MPRLAAEMEEGTVASWLVAEGDPIEKGQPLFQVESEKANVEVEAPASGFLRSLKVVAGTTVKCGTSLALIATGDEMVLETLPATAPPQEAPPAGVVPRVGASSPRLPHRSTPAARRVAAELNVDVGQIHGTGPGGRVIEDNVRAYALARNAALATAGAPRAAAQKGEADPLPQPTSAAVATAAPPTDTASTVFAQAETIELSRLRRVTGERMVESVRQAPHFDLTVDVDMEEASRLRDRWYHETSQESGKASYTAILTRAVSQILVRHPMVNATFQAGQLRLLKEINLGIAMAVKDGLMVPVVRNADRKSLSQLSNALEDLRKRAAEMRFKAEELSGGTFTISNLGMYGIDQFSAIINPPEAAILAVGQIAKRAVVVDDHVVIRPIMTMTLSVDHRVLDGAIAAAFLRDVKRVLENPYLLI